mmetsp:Transcript_1581/g.4689  ORF Transcript_1581/g.4689 Transcript_1581/m.4689 type:complete len:348 (-) Transcript_1581:25-1068(-)
MRHLVGPNCSACTCPLPRCHLISPAQTHCRAVSSVRQLSLLLTDLHASGGGDDAHVHHVQEQAVVHHTLQPADGCRCRLSVFDGGVKVQVNNVVAVVCDVRAAVCVFPELGFAARNLWEVLQPVEVVLPAELHNLHWHGIATATEALDQLGVIHDAHKLGGSHLYHLLAQKGATAALDNIKEGVYLVSAVNGQVQLGLLAQSCQRDAAPLGLLVSALRGGHTNNVFQLSALQQVTDSVHRIGSSGSSPKTQHHAAADILHSLPGRLLLQLILGQRPHLNGRHARRRDPPCCKGQTRAAQRLRLQAGSSESCASRAWRCDGSVHASTARVRSCSDLLLTSPSSRNLEV